uniref:Putative tick kunitz 91 n=1 Tax=Amblyomma triste TaxID=251400 RepID=A0A023G510_AMBTT
MKLKFSVFMAFIIGAHCLVSMAKPSYPRTRAHCFQPLKVGTACGKSERAKWFFNVTSQTCDEFKYLGCGGNANRFPSEDFCLDLCKSETKRDDGITEADKASCREHTGDIIEPHPEAACNQRLDRGGSCPGNQPRVYWYYDQETKNCSRFLHCGCGGNDNKFPNEEFCLQCNPENGEYIYEDVSRDR